MECPEENVFVDFVRGELPRNERASLEAHIDECEVCSMVVAEMARLFGPDESADSAGSADPELEPVDPRLLDTDGAFSPTAVTQSSGEILSEPAAMLPQGAKLGRYVVIDKVGAGGMGVVYAAYDPELDRKVALKVLRRGALASGRSSGDKQRDRLMREAQAMAKLSHPNVITVHDVGTFEGQVFLAMEFIDGQTLGDWIRQGNRTWREVLEVFIAAGRGLAAAHAVGLVHRDFKPDNVLMGNDGRVLVTDFGLARPAAGKTGAFSSVGEVPSMQVLTASLTQTGALVGTPAYMAPEQLSGSRTGPKTDQFSFCVTLYEGLYGKRPFMGRSFAELASNVSSGAFTPPPRDVSVPRRVRRALFRGLSTDPELRFADMNELIHALRHDPWRPWRRWGAVVMPAGLFMVGAIAYQQSQSTKSSYCDRVDDQLVGVWDDERRQEVEQAFLATERAFAHDALATTTRKLDEYALRWVGMQSAACRDQLRGEQPQAVLALRMHCLERRREGLRTVAELLTVADGAVVEGAVDVTRGLAQLDPCEDLDALTQSVPAPPESPQLRRTVGELERELAKARVLRQAAKYDESEAILREALELATQTGYRPLEAEALGTLASTLDRGGKFDEAEAMYHRALSAALAAGHASVMGYVSVGLVWLTGVPERPLDEAERWATHGLAAIEPLGHMPELRAQLYHALAIARLQHGKLDEAEQALNEVIAVREAAFGKGHHSLGAVMASRGRLMAMRGRFDEAVSALRLSRKHIEHEYGAFHPQSATVMINLAAALSERGDPEKAREIQEQALRIQEINLGPDHPEVATSHLNMAATLDALGDARLSKQHALTALESFRKTYGEDSVELAWAMSTLATAETNLGQLERSVELRQQALALTRKKLGDDHPRVGRYRHNLAEALLKAGRMQPAEAEFRAALDVRTRAHGGDHPKTGESAAALAELLTDHLGRADEAVGLAEQAVRVAALGKVSDAQRGYARFVLADALWRSKAHRDRARARTMAELARDDLASTGRDPEQIAAIERWLAAHPAEDVAAPPQ
ncbi:MAG: tetratricopeptide repeat protein [Myxococcota bacterium]